MKDLPIEASCPACGGPITFKIGSSVVVVCEFCNSVVARGDRKLEDLGKVADLTETGSPLDIGLRGSYRGVSFELTGRAQLGHEAGGVWDEWYAAFADGRWGWLAEAQGRFYITFQQSMPEQSLLPPFEMLELGQPVAAIAGSVPLMVAEKGEASALGAKGEIPYRLTPGETYYYADLSGSGGAFATLDYSETPPMVFIGREVTLADLSLAAIGPGPEREVRRVSALQLSCPQCGGALDLRAPDKTERVTCPNCGSLLDVSHGKLEFLKALGQPKVAPIIPIGSVGQFGNDKLTVIGFMQRSVEYEGVRYFWEEYLLYEPQVGFRWLVRSDDHWNFVQSVPPGEVTASGRNVYYGGKRFKLYQEAIARVDIVLGEFYWKVTTEELVKTADYVCPPLMLSMEVPLSVFPGEDAGASEEPKKRQRKKAKAAGFESGEINWSLGAYLNREDVEKAFGIKGLPKPSKVAPNQLFPHKAVYKYWLFLFVATLVFGLFVMSTGSHQKIFENTYQFEPLKASDGSTTVFSEPFHVDGGKNLRIAARGTVDNSWLYVEGDLIDESTGLVQSFSMPVEYYHGVEDGESWSEGDQSPDIFISALPPGNYTLRLEAQWEHWQQPVSMTLRIEQGVPRALHLLFALVMISIIPIFVAYRHYRFEVRRWADSDYSPFSSG
ncbi:MAG TPA: DUF4178 domain-containing protein [Blastocatellia bacterium]|nr:DUF4178 domain-containing protein [Blastocatellia bacterium]